jgi:hypothetical protein
MAGLACGSPEAGPAVSLAQKGDAAAERAGARTHTFELFSLQSRTLADFGGEKTKIEATVLLPPGHDPGQRYPVNYYVHGFGGSHREAAASHGTSYGAMMVSGDAQPMIHVFLDANHPMGHHVFADSENTGPWGEAFVEEFVPELEKKFGGAGVPWGRFVSGHSSGGWSSLWLQIAYPEFFGGVWSTAPDPVDFRDFTGIDMYANDNMYRDPEGRPYPLMRRDGGWVTTFEEYTRKEIGIQPRGGQIYSFDAVFSERESPGRPRFVFDRNSGQIDKEVFEHWKRYDISLKLRNEWDALGPKLAGKLNIFVGTQDTFRLEGAVRLLDQELEKLGSDATIVLVDGRSHFDLGEPSPEHYPRGLKQRVVDEMWATWEAGEAKKTRN